jgi:flavin-dependent thymidylate synthase
MIIQLIGATPYAKEMLIFTKNTRHLGKGAEFTDILDMTERQKDEELSYVFGTIRSALEFVDYTFVLHDVTRAFTHQLVRHRVGTSFAQKSLRVADENAFDYLIPDGIEEDQYKMAVYNSTMNNIQDGYNILLKKGTEIQDARGVLPTNICTSIVLKINLAAFVHMMETRLCVRAQGEYQDAVKTMRSLVLELHPWVAPLAGPMCATNGYCLFKRFEDCPIKKANKHLQNPPTDKIMSDWESINSHGTVSPQPELSKGASDASEN